MPETNIGAADYSNLTDAVTNYSVSTQQLDTAGDQDETKWSNAKWTQQLGYYKTIPELGAAIDAKATWTVGKGFEADPETTFVLQSIRGWGKETFNALIENMIRTYHIGGDAFCEILRDKDGNLINLKALDPGSIVIVANRQGQIKRYEQINKIKGGKPTKFKPEEIFHISRNRVADEIHGISMIDRLEPIILMRNEAMTDWRRVLHRNVDPVWIFHLDTDDAAKIAGFKAKMDAARGRGENMYIPKDAVVPELVATAANATLNPQPWIDSLNNYFYEACGTPKIIIGNAQEFTEASAKISYLAFQQTIEEEQLYIEEQCGMQLGIAIELEFPASLENELLSDKKKDGDMTETKPSETTAGQGQ